MGRVLGTALARLAGDRKARWRSAAALSALVGLVVLIVDVWPGRVNAGVAVLRVWQVLLLLLLLGDLVAWLGRRRSAAAFERDLRSAGRP